MKRVLLLAAVAVIVAVLAYSLQPRESGRVSMSFERMSKVANDLAMIKPRLRGTDASGDPYVVTADRAVQDGPSAHRARLYNVQADMTLKKGTWITASAARGLLDADAKTLHLDGGLSVFSDTGYELHTQEAQVNLGTGLIAGNREVTGHGPLGTLRADRFVVNRTARTVHLLGEVKMQFYPHGAKQK